MKVTMVVARWEFFRFFKWRSEFISLLITLLVLTGGYLSKPLMEWVRGTNTETLAIVGDLPSLAAFESLPLTVTQWPQDFSVEEAMAALADEQLDAVAVWDAQEQRMALTVMRTPSWQPLFEAAVSRQAVAARLDQSSLPREEFAAITAPAATQIALHADAKEEPGKFQRYFGMAAVFLPMVGVFSAFSYFFVSITGEKQNRLGEQLLSAVGVERWLDGKLIGLTALCLKSMLMTGVMLAVGFLLVQQLSDKPMVLGVINPGSLLMALLFSVLAMTFWSTFLAAVAATISDPNNSARSGIMMLPAVFMLLPLAATDIPSAPGVILLSILPITSTAFMPMRLVLSDVPLWQVLLSAVIMVFTIGLMRSIAQRVLKVAMLMFGQEPTLAQIRQMLKESA